VGTRTKRRTRPASIVTQRRRDDGSGTGVTDPRRHICDQRPSVVLRSGGPFDLPLSLAAAASFFPISGPAPVVLAMPIYASGDSTIVTIWQPPKTSSLICASAVPTLDRMRLLQIAKWLISGDLDLRPFYELVAMHPVMGPVVASLKGLKPLRPATLFEMSIIAITEQQLSLAAAFHIRSRLVRRFGTQIDGLWIFPSPERLATASLYDLSSCGLSHQKAKYVKELARRVMEDALDFDALKRQSDLRIREVLLSNRGFGEWSVQYILARGFGRPDSLPSGDVGLRRVVGKYFARDRKLTAAQLEEVLSPFRPFRGLAAFYLAVHWRLRCSA
jgi:3-methyladenine DNA glycosylase/8-oxoguanine DNA glycosylase